MDEINEDNCVLSDKELRRLIRTLEIVKKNMSKELPRQQISTMISKITKLNEMAKEKNHDI